MYLPLRAPVWMNFTPTGCSWLWISAMHCFNLRDIPEDFGTGRTIYSSTKPANSDEAED